MAIEEQVRADGTTGSNNFGAPSAKPLHLSDGVDTARRSPTTRETNGNGVPMVARRAPADVRLPCMLYAAVGALSNDGGGDTRLAVAQIRKMHGVLHVISYEGGPADAVKASCAGIAVVTRGYWFSRQALARLMAQCGGMVGMFAWDCGAEPAEADARVTRGTAQFIDGHLRLWLATVDAGRSRASAARLAGIAEDLVDLRIVGQPQSEAGRNVLVSAIAVARALAPAPVQVIVAQDFEHYPEAPGARGNLMAVPVPHSLRIVSAKELAA